MFPITLRDLVLDSYHKYAHYGMMQMTRMISSRYFWFGLANDCENYVKSCHECALMKRNPLTYKTKLNPLLRPTSCFEEIQIDMLVLYWFHNQDETEIY